MDDRTLLLQSQRQRVITKAKEAGEQEYRKLQQKESGIQGGLLDRKYNYSGNSFTAKMPIDFDKNIEPAVEQKQLPKDLSKKQKDAITKERIALETEAEMYSLRSEYEGKEGLSEEQMKAEEKLLNDRIAAIKASEEAALEDCKLFGDKQKKLEIRMNAAKDIAAAFGEYAGLMELDTEIRELAMKQKEEADIKYNSLKKELKVEQMTDSEEQSRERDTIRRHGFYDVIKSIFKKDNPLSAADVAYKVDFLDSPLINKERAFFGGTKPMYVFEDRDIDHIVGTDAKGEPIYKQYLYKEAINCLGAAKPDRALVTEAASNLQEYLFGKANSVKAFVARDDDGTVIGSFQERILTMEKTAQGAVDLFKWQAKPDLSLQPEVIAQVMREHTLDWLLCNFDTKGENFLQKQDGSLVSIDKEASFSKLKESGAQHMSRTYQPHSNETIYNTMFRMYVEQGMNIDFDAAEQYITRMEQMSDTEYLKLFVPMLDLKYGKASTTNMDRAKAVELLMLRKENLRKEYKTFYGSLIKERQEKVYKDRVKEVKKAGGDTSEVKKEVSDRLDANGNYLFASEREELRRQTEAAAATGTGSGEETFQTQTINPKTAVFKFDGDDDLVPLVDHLSEEASKWKLDDKKIYEYSRVKINRGGDAFAVQTTISMQNARLDKAKRRQMETDVLARDEASTHEIAKAHTNLNMVVEDRRRKLNQENRDPYNALLGVMQDSYVKDIRGIVRADISGYERARHIEQFAGETVLTPETVKIAEQDFQNLYMNLYKDELIERASSFEFPEEFMDKVYAFYLARGYLEPLAIDYYTTNGEAYSEEQKKDRKEALEKYGHITKIFKTDANSVTQLIEPYAKFRALEKVRAVLDANPAPTAYEKEMKKALEAEKAVVEELLRSRDVPLVQLSTTEKTFTKVDALQIYYNREQVLAMGDNFAALGRRLLELDRKGELSEDEKQEKRDIIAGVHKLVQEQSNGTRTTLYKVIQDRVDHCVGAADSLLTRTDITLSEEQRTQIESHKVLIAAMHKEHRRLMDRYEYDRQDAKREAEFASSEKPLRLEMNAFEAYLKEQGLAS